jgi:hypothetical protein
MRSPSPARVAPGSAQLLALLLTIFLILLVMHPLDARSQMRLGGFTDFLFTATDDETAQPSSGFREGQFVLHVNSSLSDRASFFAELSVSPRTNGFVMEVERTIFRYDYADAFKPSLGRYHTPVSFWNSAYHHGTWLQTSVDRPLAVKFGSNFVPIHFVGAMVDGRVFPGSVSLSYAGGVGNGRAANVARAGDTGDVNNNRAVFLRGSLRSDALYELEVGGSIYVDRFTNAADRITNERTLSAFVSLTSETPEVLAEFFLVNHEDDDTGRSYDSNSYYVQVAYRLPAFDGRVKPYARIEEMDIDDADPGFDTKVDDLKRVVGGVRIDFLESVALKLEGQRASESSREFVNRFLAAINMTF